MAQAIFDNRCRVSNGVAVLRRKDAGSGTAAIRQVPGASISRR
jgi:hypothetical protein